MLISYLVMRMVVDIIINFFFTGLHRLSSSLHMLVKKIFLLSFTGICLLVFFSVLTTILETIGLFSSNSQLIHISFLIAVRKKLSRRLLFDRSASDDHERLILTKLKQQCGGQFTSKMEGMVSYML